MAPSIYLAEINAAKKAVLLACHLCQKVQRSLAASETVSKADKSPVTVADYGAQALVSWSLQQSQSSGFFSMVAEEDSGDFYSEGGAAMLERITTLVNETLVEVEGSSAPVLSKENVVQAIDKGGSEGGPNGRHWVLDPIDGTRGFVRGDQYAIALGMLEEGEVVLGVLGCPNLPLQSLASYQKTSATASGESVDIGCLFSASKGEGTWVQPIHSHSPPKQIYVSNVNDPAWAVFCESFEAAHSQQDLTANIARVLGVTAPPVRIDSQAKYGAMARGDAAIYLRFPHKGYREKIWDHAAGSIMIIEAGGVVSDASGKPLDFSKGRFLDLDHGIVASNKILMPILLAAVQTCLKGEQPSVA